MGPAAPNRLCSFCLRRNGLSLANRKTEPYTLARSKPIRYSNGGLRGRRIAEAGPPRKSAQPGFIGPRPRDGTEVAMSQKPQRQIYLGKGVYRGWDDREKSGYREILEK